MSDVSGVGRVVLGYVPEGWGLVGKRMLGYDSWTRILSAEGGITHGV